MRSWPCLRIRSDRSRLATGLVAAALVAAMSATADDADAVCIRQLRAASAQPAAAVPAGCWRVGPIALGIEREAVEEMLGAPDGAVDEPKPLGTAFYLYPRDLRARLRERPLPTLDFDWMTIVYRGSRVAAVQIRGNTGELPFGFLLLRLNDPKIALELLLGAPKDENFSDQVRRYGGLPVKVLLDDDLERIAGLSISEDDEIAHRFLPVTLEADGAFGAPIRGFRFVFPSPQSGFSTFDFPGVELRYPPPHRR
jgi:hypothetical protein